MERLIKFLKNSPSYADFDTLPKGLKLHSRADVCALLLLSRLSKNKNEDILRQLSPTHNAILLNVDLNEIEKSATDQELKILSCCGVFLLEINSKYYLAWQLFLEHEL